MFHIMEQDMGPFNSFLANVPILYPLKTPETLGFSGVFRRYKMRSLAKSGLNNSRQFQMILTESKLVSKDYVEYSSVLKFYIKLASSGYIFFCFFLILKRDSNTGVFLRILQTF